ncbi:hypothetical protein MPRG_64250 [Mycobacterium paragordonae]|uniref:Uncharacterized protein n=1 Tax=Mycobacterium paragordonae TaxID=1389713 RepID=A0ABQ1CFE1_9MYCO|nr:hypothetical protein [Mycobacterium paragordonae]GFG83149.1 hypothetical protein MPRG_64250 [Mycobacterium paragordonae]
MSGAGGSPSGTNRRCLCNDRPQRIALCPVNFREAYCFVEQQHRHRAPPAGHKFSISVADLTGRLAGLAMVRQHVENSVRDLRNTWQHEKLLEQLDPAITTKASAS